MLVNFGPYNNWTSGYLLHVHWIFSPRRHVGAPLLLINGYGLSFFLLLFVPFFSTLLLHGDSLLLYSPLEIIRTLHLLIIWTFTWVPVSSDIYPTFLWVAVAKVTLFVCPLHINAARKVASLHLMRQLWSPPGHLILSSFFRLCEARPYNQYSFEWFLIMDRVHSGSIFGTSEETFLLGHLLK